MNSSFGYVKVKKRKPVAKTTKKCEPSSGLTKKQREMLTVKKSTIPNAGKGLFAAKDIKKGTKLGYYAGIYMNEPAYNKLKNQDYVWQIYNDRFVDAKPCPHAILRFINSKIPKKGVRRTFNVEPYSYNGKLWYRTTKDVKKGDELFIDYGEYYW